jgi:hypothetical protein
MLRKLLGTGLLLATLAGCTKLEGKPCTSDVDCATEGGLCNTSVGLCYADSEVDTCTPACAAYEACTTGGCKPRFTRLTIQAPMAGALLDAGTVQVVAQLEVTEAFKNTTQFPPMLNFTAEQTGGGALGTFANPSSDDAGTYRISWTPPAVEASFILGAAHLDADAGLSDSVNVTVDGVLPVFTASVPSFEAGAPDGGTTYADPGAAGFWPRDQQVPVEVRTDEANLDPDSIRVALLGTDGDAGPAMPATPVTTGCDAGFCGVALVNLWEPAFDAFRGTMTVDVQGRDRAGNLGTLSSPAPQVNVTRWKWAFSLPAGTIRTSPAVGAQGIIYVGTNATTEGKVLALKPDGTTSWEASVGPVASLAVGGEDGGVESIYVAVNTTSNRAALYALSSADGGTRVRCPSGTAVYNGQAQSAMAVGTIGTPPDQLEAGMAVVNNGANTRLIGVRPEASSGEECSISNPTFGVPETIQDGPLVANGSTVLYPTAAATIVSYGFFGANLDWTASTGGQLVNGLALTGSNLVGGGGSIATQGGLYSVTLPVSGTTTTATLLSGTSGGRVWNPLVGTGGTIAFFGQDTGSTQGDLKRYDLPGQTLASPSILDVDVLKYAPALGADGVLYTASSASVVTARSANDLSERWMVPLPAASTASVALDCARSPSGAPASGRRGTLYVPAGATLHAIIVDSPGLGQGTAAWPKYQHDARNTGNPATPITNCP